MSEKVMEVDTALDAVQSALDEIQLAFTDTAAGAQTLLAIASRVAEALDRAETLVRSARDELRAAKKLAEQHAGGQS